MSTTIEATQDTLATIHETLLETLNELELTGANRDQDARRETIKQLVRHADSSHTRTLAAIGRECGEYVYTAVAGFEGETRKGKRKDSVKLLATDNNRTADTINQWIRAAHLVDVFPSAGDLRFGFVNTMLPIVKRDELTETYTVADEHLAPVNELIVKIVADKLDTKAIVLAVNAILGKPVKAKTEKSEEPTEAQEAIADVATAKAEDCLAIGQKLTALQLGALVEGFFAGQPDATAVKYLLGKVSTLVAEFKAAQPTTEAKAA